MFTGPSGKQGVQLLEMGLLLHELGEPSCQEGMAGRVNKRQVFNDVHV